MANEFSKKENNKKKFVNKWPGNNINGDFKIKHISKHYPKKKN